MNKPDIYYLINDGDIEGYYTDFNTAIADMEEAIDNIIEHSFLNYGYKPEEIYKQFVEKQYTSIAIVKIKFDDEGRCPCYYNEPNQEDFWDISDIEEVKEHIMQRQREYTSNERG